MATPEKNGIKKADTQLSGSETKTKGEKQKTLKDLLKHGLKCAYTGETQLSEALPKIKEAVYSEELQDTLQKHSQETKRHIERLEKIFNRLNIDKTTIGKCKIMEALTENATKILDKYEEGSVRDSALIIAVQKIAHHKIASYGSLCELADVLGQPQIFDLLDRSLQEEERADKILTDIAYDVNDDAYEMSQDEVYQEA